MPLESDQERLMRLPVNLFARANLKGTIIVVGVRLPTPTPGIPARPDSLLTLDEGPRPYGTSVWLAPTRRIWVLSFKRWLPGKAPYLRTWLLNFRWPLLGKAPYRGLASKL